MSKLFEDIIDSVDATDDEVGASELVSSGGNNIFTDDEMEVTQSHSFQILGTVRIVQVPYQKMFPKEAYGFRLHQILENSRMISEFSKISLEMKNDIVTMTYAFNIDEDIKIVDAINFLTRINNAFYSKRVDKTSKKMQEFAFYKRTGSGMYWQNVLNFSLAMSSNSLRNMFEQIQNTYNGKGLLLS